MIATAIAAAQAAGGLLRRSFGQGVQVNETFAHDLKIQADIDAQALIADILLSEHPNHRLTGEEGNAGNPGGAFEWIVDPIDGTMNYAMGIPHFCVSIACRHEGRMIAGVIYDPLREEMFTAEAGGQARLNGRDIRVSNRTRLADAVLAIGFSKSREAIDHCLEMYRYYGPNCRKTRAMGSAALDLAYVAAGRLDAYIESSIGLWDFAAGAVIVEAAGGHVVITERGDGRYQILASSGRIDYPLR
jgi:myo-inositol-1(or 4)-monophosphatase